MALRAPKQLPNDLIYTQFYKLYMLSCFDILIDHFDYILMKINSIKYLLLMKNS